MTEPAPIDTMFEYTFAASYRPDGRGVGTRHDRFRLVFESAASPDALAEAGNAVAAELAPWVERTFGDLGPVFGPGGALVRPARLLDEVLEAPFDLAGLARWVWEAWAGRLPALSSVAVVLVEREAAGWPEGASSCAARFTADRLHRVFLKRVATGEALLDDRGRCDSPLGDRLRAGGWAAYKSGKTCRPHHDADGEEAWQAAVARIADGEQLATALAQLRAWFEACCAFGRAVANAGSTDDAAARMAVWEARQRAREASRPWLETLAEPLEGARLSARFQGRMPRGAWLMDPLAYREFPQGSEWHQPLEEFLVPLSR